MPVQYNDYVLNTALEQGWISSEQKTGVEAALAAIPNASALDFMAEQQLLTVQQVQAFQKAILAAESGETLSAHHEKATVSVPDSSSHLGAWKEPLSSINDYLKIGRELQASDIHLGVGSPPMMRRFGTLQPIWTDAPPLTRDETERLIRGFLDNIQKDLLKERGDADFCYAHSDLGRFRTSIVKQRRGFDAVFRLIETKVRTFADLGLPEYLKRLTQYNNGLVLITGSVGSGKSTTMAALIDEVNRMRHDHIITLEDPIEYKFDSLQCHVTQREVHTHTHSFATALRASLREDPDVIMVGEMRDLETISLAITAAETGHLVFSTLHTANAARTLDRVLDVFPPDQQEQIRVMVSESLRGIISQQLVPRADGKGRALALEILINTPAVASLIRDGKTFMLPGVMQTGKKQGMKLMDDSLMELLQQGVISPQEAWDRAEHKKFFQSYLK